MRYFDNEFENLDDQNLVKKPWKTYETDQYF